MTRLLVGDEWYGQVAPAALYETEYEKVVLQQSEALFPGYHMGEFKAAVYSDSGVARPDCALVSKAYHDWWIVEIEMAHHSLESHVLPQVTTLATGYYDEQHAFDLCRRLPQLESSRTKSLLKGNPPRVLVIVNSPSPDWVLPLKRYAASLLVVEIFRSGTNRRILRVDGEAPTPKTRCITTCRSDPILPNCLIVDSPGSLLVAAGSTLQIRYEGFVTEWTRTESRDRVWLISLGANPLPGRGRYEIHEDPVAGLLFRPTI